MLTEASINAIIKARMKYDVAPWRRHRALEPHWKSVRFHPPESGREYKVRLSPDQPEFRAVKLHSMNGWMLARPATDGKIMERLGDRFESTPQMEYFA